LISAFNRVSRGCRTHPVLVIGVWIAIALIGNLFVPHISSVILRHAIPILPADSPSAVALQNMGREFADSTSSNLTYVVLERDSELGGADRDFYVRFLDRLAADHEHVDSAIDLWTDPITRPASESEDGRVAYVLLRLQGQLGTTAAANSVAAVRAAVADLGPPPGLTVYVTGPGPTVADELSSVGNEALVNTAVTGAVISLLLYVMYRSLVTVLIPLIPVVVALAVARPTVAFLGEREIIALSLFSENLLAAITLGAVTNYGIFLVGRYHEFRRAGLPPDQSLDQAYRSIAPVVAASALTVALALASLNLAEVGLLRSAGLPCAISLLVGLVAALTVTPALIALAARRGMAEPRVQSERGRWRRVGVAVARWPGPVLSTAVGVLIILALPVVFTHISFNEAKAQPSTTESNLGYAAMDRHFPPNRILPEIVAITAGTDLRTPAGLIAIENVTRKLLEIREVRLVQSGSRPAGAILPESQITTQIGQIANRLSHSADDVSTRLGSADDALAKLAEMDAALSRLDGGLARGESGLADVNRVTAGLADGLGKVEAYLMATSDYLAPLRNYTRPAPECAGAALCAGVTKLVEPVDAAMAGTARLTGGVNRLQAGSRSGIDSIAAARGVVANVRASVRDAEASIGEVSSAVRTLEPQMDELIDYARGLSESFNGASEGGFYLPEQALGDPRFGRVLELLFSADGRSTRLLVVSAGEVFGSDGAQLSREVQAVAAQATKDGLLRGATIEVAGVGSVVRDLETAMWRDFAILAVVALTLVLLIVTLLLRSPVAGLTVVMTVAASYVSAIAVSALFWRTVFGYDLHWSVPPISFIALVAVGADYNLLLSSRLKEECVAGIRTGMIRTFQGTGTIVTSAGLIFALTMFALVRSGIVSIAQIGTTIGIGLLIDTFLVRSFVVPTIAGLLGRWFWWPFRLRDAKTGLGAR
jgi:putative drug exporter of the RND superfamily